MENSTSTNTNSTIPEMDAILEKLERIKELEDEINSVKLEIHNIAEPLKKERPEVVQNLSTKTGYKGKFYSIRQRFNEDLKRQIYYVCGSDVAFGSWLKGRGKKGKKDEEGSD